MAGNGGFCCVSKTVVFVGRGSRGAKLVFGGFSGHGRFQLFGGLQNGKMWLFCGINRQNRTKRIKKRKKWLSLG